MEPALSLDTIYSFFASPDLFISRSVIFFGTGKGLYELVRVCCRETGLVGWSVDLPKSLFFKRQGGTFAYMDFLGAWLFFHCWGLHLRWGFGVGI